MNYASLFNSLMDKSVIVKYQENVSCLTELYQL